MKWKIVLLLALAVSLFLPPGLRAQQEASESATISAQPVDYYLPHPGRLPDDPLYWVKMVRDRVELWLTLKPEAKAEKLLLYADKRLGAGWALIEKNKPDLGVTTLTKGEKYLERAISLSQHLDETRLAKAKAKHMEVLKLLQPKVGARHEVVMTAMLSKLTSLTLPEVEALPTVTVVIQFDSDTIANQQGMVKAANALDALKQLTAEQALTLSLKEYGFGTLVSGIGDLSSNQDKAWIYFVNGDSGQVAADQRQLNEGDLVEWKYIQPEN